MTDVIKRRMFGRTEICSNVESVTRENIVRVLGKALVTHNQNSLEIDYLYRYMRGQQPILSRTKQIRPEINNRVVENHAIEIAQFTSGYFLGEPVTYVRRGDREKSSEEIGLLNDYMFEENKSSHDKDLATWMAICGVAYRMVLPRRKDSDSPYESPFRLDTPDPRNTFIVYHSGFGHRRLLGAQVIEVERDDGQTDKLCCGYTDTHYFEVNGTTVRRWEPHSLGGIPIFEYRLNMYRMGSFEPALEVLDTINNLTSNRMDAVETFVQSFLKFKNCEIDDTQIEKLARLGAIKIKSADGLDADVELISQELNQTQTQTYVDYLYEQALVICGLPTTTKGGTSTSDTGAAVLLRDGWQQCEARAKDTEQLFKRSEREFLRIVLGIMNVTRDIDLPLSDVECKFTRRQHDNLLTKTQGLLNMLEAGLKPEVAIAACGLFNDPMDVSTQSVEYLEKWRPTEDVPEETERSDGAAVEKPLTKSRSAREGG